MATLSSERFHDFFRWYKGERQQIEGVQLLYEDIMKCKPDILDEQARWISKYEQKPPAPSFANPLVVPWQSQNDNASGTGYRECFSSSCAMLAMYWGKVSSDDEYIKVRSRYGDTINPQAQLAALRYLGLTANYYTNGSKADLMRLIGDGRPVAVGWLHHGVVARPTGGGHWTVIVGYTAKGTIHNDPNGEANLVAGGYTPNTQGKQMAYSDANWMPRWQADGANSGWYLECHK